MVDMLPTVNASLNAGSLICLILGWRAIQRGDRVVHARFMVGAVGCSAVFLVGYLTRTYLTGTHTFPDVGWVRTLYLAVLFSHMLLAIVVVPLVLRLLFLVYRQRFQDHRRLARWTWPIWIYVSFTGVVVYVMLYHVAPSLTG